MISVEENKYKQSDPELIIRIKETAKQLGSETKVAEAMNVNKGYLNSYVNNKFVGDIDAFELKIKEYYKNLDEAKTLKSTQLMGTYKPIGTSESVYKTIRKVHLEGLFTIACGDSGIGKTMAAEKYIKDYPASSIMITVDPCISTLRAFLILLADELKISIRKNTNELKKDILKNLKGDRKAIIIDESQHLSIAIIELIRNFVDKNNTLGVCFVGDARIRNMLTGDSEQTRQIRNRVHWTESKTTKDIKMDDITLLFPMLPGVKEKHLILNKAQSDAGIRGACHIVKNAINANDLSYNVLVALAGSSI